MGSKRAGSATTVEAELVDIDWVAKRLGVTVRHVRRLVAERRIPLVKWGHLLRFDPEEVESWIDSARRPAGARAAEPAMSRTPSRGRNSRDRGRTAAVRSGKPFGASSMTRPE